jgi:hypothetical protein
MKTFYTLVTFVFFVVGTPWYAYVMFDDFCHPEIWDHDAMHDPRFYLPIVAVVLPLCVLAMWWEGRKLRRMEKESRERVQRLTADANVRN